MPAPLLQYNKQETNLLLANGDLFKAIYEAPSAEHLIIQLDQMYTDIDSFTTEWPTDPYYGTLDGVNIIDITAEVKRPRFTEF